MTDTEYKVNKGQIATIHVLLGHLLKSGQFGKRTMTEVKADLVSQYTDRRETSTTKLTWKEARDMIAALERQTGERKAERDAKADRKKKRILFYAHQMGHELPGGKVDMDWVNGWCAEYGYLHKPLNDYTVTELSKLIWQMEQVYKDYLKAV